MQSEPLTQKFQTEKQIVLLIARNLLSISEHEHYRWILSVPYTLPYLGTTGVGFELENPPPNEISLTL